MTEVEVMLDSVGASEDRGNLWNTVASTNGAKRAKVVNEDKPQYDNASFLVGLQFMSKDVFLGNPFAVTKMVKDALREVESVRVNKSGIMLMSSVSKEPKEKALYSQG
ncbi:hypothetical protein J4Q44_G00344950, partial [Coregonus suidteri]